MGHAHGGMVDKETNAAYVTKRWRATIGSDRHRPRQKEIIKLKFVGKKSIRYSSIGITGCQQQRVITMPELSQGAYLAWRLAAGETARASHPCIEKEFILIGLCRLGRWLRSKAHGENAPLKGPALRAVSTEAQTVEAALKACALSPDLLCQ